MTVRCLGIDLAWKDGPDAPETGVVALEADGTIVDAGWTRGVAATVEWVTAWAEPDTVVFVDAPLLVDNPSGQRPCDRTVGQHYGRWKVSANSINLASPRLGGVGLAQQLAAQGFVYDDGLDGPRPSGRHVYECYPYTAIVGVAELGFDVRPTYKRKPRALRTAAFRPVRAAACDALIARVNTLVDPPLSLASHPMTAMLLTEGSPVADKAYKHREDLLDAAICAWTAQLWLRYGTERVQPLRDLSATHRPQATIMAPYKPEQRQTR